MEKLYAGKTIENVIHTYSDTLLRLAFQTTKSKADAEDIAQTAFIKLYKQKSIFESEAHVKAWLIRVTINLTKDFFRSAWYQRIVPIKEGMDFLAPEEQRVMAEVFELKREARTIIYLYYYEGYTIDEIATILKKNPNTISSKLQRARKKLKTIIVEWRDES